MTVMRCKTHWPRTQNAVLVGQQTVSLQGWLGWLLLLACCAARYGHW
jgi:hypothetical protein